MLAHRSPLVLGVLLALAAGSGRPAADARAPVSDAPFAQLPLHFVENRGQVDGRVGFYLQGQDTSLYFQNDGLTLVLSEQAALPHQAGPDSRPHGSRHSAVARQRWALKVEFVNAAPDVRPVGDEPTGAVVSYFSGGASAQRAAVPTYSRVVYRDLWPGVQLAYRGASNAVKYEFVLRPGTDPARIRLRWRGASGLRVTDTGELEVQTPLRTVRDQKPYAYQDVDGRRVEVPAAYAVDPATSEYGFTVGAYDGSRPLVLDPAVFVYAGFLGGVGFDSASDLAVDATGHVYVTGMTDSAQDTFPVGIGPDLVMDGSSAAFVAKVHADGSGLVYAGYIEGVEVAHGIAVDSDGNAYVTGSVSTDAAGGFPVVAAIDPTYGGNGYSDAFLTKVNAAGTALVYSTYLGGTAPDMGFGVAVDAWGNAYVTGLTGGESFPVTVGPDASHNGGDDAFVVKVNAAGTALVYSGYVGGDGTDWGRRIAVDSAGNAYITGQTTSTEATFPVAGGPGVTHRGGIYDAFVAKVAADGTSLSYAGYIGGAEYDQGNDIAVDAAGAAYIVGFTNSSEASFPVTTGPDLTYNGGNFDAFIAKVRPAGDGLAYTGYIGGLGDDRGIGVAVDTAGNALAVGMTDSTEVTFPIASGPDLTANGSSDAFITKVATTGTSLVYSGFIGGADGELGFGDVGVGLAVDALGNAYVAGPTGSDAATFPTLAGPSLVAAGGGDAFVVKISDADGGGSGGVVFVGTELTAIQCPPGVTHVAGSVLIANNPLAVSIDCGNVQVFSGDVTISHNAVATSIALGAGETFDGSVTIIDNPAVSAITLPAAQTIAGDVRIVDNAAAVAIELSNVRSFDGDVDILTNESATTIDLGTADVIDGNIAIVGNAAAAGIDLSGATTVNGDVAILDNGSVTTCAEVELGALAIVTGNLAVASCGSGTFAPGPVSPGGALDVRATGYVSVAGTTAHGVTSVTLANGEARMTATLPSGALAVPASFTITRLDPGLLEPGLGTAPDGSAATVDLLVGYVLTFAVPTLDSPATLTFEVLLAGLDAATREALLSALASGLVTLATQGDAAGGAYQTYPLCTGDVLLEGCARLEVLDAAGEPTTESPAAVRISGLTDHFSTWGVAIVSPRATAAAFNGLLDPYPAPPHTVTPTFQRKSVVPLRFSWVDATGTVIDSAGASPSIAIYAESCTAQSVSPTAIATDDAGASGLRYDADTRTWTFNWSTRSVAAGCYVIRITPGDAAYAAPPDGFAVALRDR